MTMLAFSQHAHQLIPLVFLIVLVLFSSLQPSAAFLTPTNTQSSTFHVRPFPFDHVTTGTVAITMTNIPQPLNHHQHQQQHSTTSTTLYYGKIIDVPDGFFTCLFPILGFAMAISKQIARSRLEERAFELRLEEARIAKLQNDPTLTRNELKRQEASSSTGSAYGKSRSTTTTTVMTKPTMTTEQDISQFETDYGIEYDPYYDDPYTLEELPNDETFRTDKVYGDRIYDNGEVFYFDKQTNVYYRQGSKPRVKNFWS